MTSFLKKLMISLIAFCLALVLVELALRVFWNNPYHKTHPARIVELRLLTPLLERSLDREWLGLEEKVMLRTDERGYILPVHQHPDPDFTVAFLGGSTTECRYVTENLRFPHLVSELLKEEGQSVNILNAARSGNTTHDSINAYFNHVALDNPDIVVLMHAINDHGLLARDPVYASRGGQVVNLRRQAKWLLLDMSTRSSLFGLLREIEYMVVPYHRQVGMITSSIGPQIDVQPFANRLKTYVSMVRGFGAVPVLMTQPLAEARTELTPEWADTPNQRRFNEAVRAVAASMNVPLVDLERRLEEHADYVANPLTYLYDGIHATDAGSRFYAREIATILSPLIQEMGQKAPHDH